MAVTDKMVLQGHIGTARHHFCPTCPANEEGRLEPMAPSMIMPGRRIVYHCKRGHTANSGETILK